MSAMSVGECILWMTLALTFFRKGLAQRFPVMAAFIGLHVVAVPALALLLLLMRRPDMQSLFVWYFFGYHAVYIVSAVLILFICVELFRSTMAAFSGLLKIGVVIFRWVALVSLILAFSSIPFQHRDALLLPDIGNGMMRSVSLLELCLLAFLFLSMNALGLAIRDFPIGMALGFGIMMGNDLIAATLLNSNTPMNSPIELLYQALVLVYLGVWITYCLLPSRAARPVVLLASSAIYRWNEIALALGHTGTKIAPQQASNGFFLTDVELVVEKVLNRNLKDQKSEL